MKEEPITRAGMFRAYEAGWEVGYHCGRRSMLADVIFRAQRQGPDEGFENYCEDLAEYYEDNLEEAPR